MLHFRLWKNDLTTIHSSYFTRLSQIWPPPIWLSCCHHHHTTLDIPLEKNRTLSLLLKNLPPFLVFLPRSIILWNSLPSELQKSSSLNTFKDPLEAILVIFGRRALIFFCLKALGRTWKMTPLLRACAVVISLETQKCRKRAPRSVKFNFFINWDRHKQFSQNERRRADLQNNALDFLFFA